MGISRIWEGIKSCSRVMPPVQADTNGHLVPLSSIGIRFRDVPLGINGGRVRGGVMEEEGVDTVRQGVRQGGLPAARRTKVGSRAFRTNLPAYGYEEPAVFRSPELSVWTRSKW